jgi:hypothetical protein
MNPYHRWKGWNAFVARSQERSAVIADEREVDRVLAAVTGPPIPEEVADSIALIESLFRRRSPNGLVYISQREFILANIANRVIFDYAQEHGGGLEQLRDHMAHFGQSITFELGYDFGMPT